MKKKLIPWLLAASIMAFNMNSVAVAQEATPSTEDSSECDNEQNNTAETPNVAMFDVGNDFDSKNTSDDVKSTEFTNASSSTDENSISASKNDENDSQPAKTDNSVDNDEDDSNAKNNDEEKLKRICDNEGLKKDGTSDKNTATEDDDSKEDESDEDETEDDELESTIVTNLDYYCIINISYNKEVYADPFFMNDTTSISLEQSFEVVKGGELELEESSDDIEAILKKAELPNSLKYSYDVKAKIDIDGKVSIKSINKKQPQEEITEVVTYE
ncbi:MAG: hypothetical protein K5769_10875 [Pseudobutyrivibrio sp.]|nr:hypothetical protein [Pseudobutyrivibrio sp.]